jgi:hypothetical protein
MTTPPAGQQQADPEGQRVQALDDRFGAIEAEQAEQRGLLEQIRDAIGGTGRAAPAHATAGQATETTLERRETIAELTRRAVEDVNAKTQRDQADAAHAAEHAELKARREAEQQPREPQRGPKAAAQRFLLGKPD